MTPFARLLNLLTRLRTRFVWLGLLIVLSVSGFSELQNACGQESSAATETEVKLQHINFHAVTQSEPPARVASSDSSSLRSTIALPKRVPPTRQQSRASQASKAADSSSPQHINMHAVMQSEPVARVASSQIREPRTGSVLEQLAPASNGSVSRPKASSSGDSRSPEYINLHAVMRPEERTRQQSSTAEKSPQTSPIGLSGAIDTPASVAAVPSVSQPTSAGSRLAAPRITDPPSIFESQNTVPSRISIEQAFDVGRTRTQPAANSSSVRVAQAAQPPAFGPGSPDYGQPFFATPGVDAPAPGQSLPSPSPTQSTATAETFLNPEQTIVEQVHEPAPSTSVPVGTPYFPQGQGFSAVTDNAPQQPGTWRFNFHNAPWETVLKNYARQAGLSLQLVQFPPGVFTYYDQRSYSFAESLDILNDYLLREGFLLVRNENKLTSISANNAFQDGVVPFIALHRIPTLGRNELVSVAFPSRGNSAAQSVSEVQRLLSPVGRVYPLGNSNRLIVTDTGASLRRLRDLLNGSGLASSEVEHAVLHLRNTKADLVAQAVNQRLGTSSDSEDSAGGVVQASLNTAGGKASVVAETQTNSLLIQGTPEERSRIEWLVRQIDRDPPQVVIQALLVEVQLGNTDEQGVELGFQDSVLFNRSVIDNIVSIAETATAPNGVQTTNQNVLSQTAAPGFAFNGSPLGNNTSVNPSNVGKQSLTNLGLGRLNGDLGYGGLVLSAGSNSVNVLLRALAANHKIDVLSRPQVRAVDNHEALIQIGQQVPVVDGVTLAQNGTANPVVRQDKSGIILRVTPRISEGGLVQIDVQAEKSAFQLTPGSGVPIFTDATSGNVIEAPVKDITTAETTVSALSGQTIVLGGMITRDVSNVDRKVPLLGDIPLLGRLFRVDFSQTTRKELLIFLTPTVINNACDSDAVGSREASRISLDIDSSVDLHQDFLRGADPAGWAMPPMEHEVPMMSGAVQTPIQ